MEFYSSRIYPINYRILNLSTNQPIENDVRDDEPDADSKKQALALAENIVTAGDEGNLHPTEIMPALWALTVYKGVRGFSFVPLDTESFEIYLHGSKKRIPPKDGEYDLGGTVSNEEIDKIKYKETSARKKRTSEVELRDKLTVLGFRNAGEFVERLGNLRNKLKSVDIPGLGKLDDLEVGLRGSSVTGESTKGGNFRQGIDGVQKPSDLDFFFTSKKLEEFLEKKGFDLSDPISPNNFDSFSPEFKEMLLTFGAESRRQLGRKSDAYFLSTAIINGLTDGDFILK